MDLLGTLASNAALLLGILVVVVITVATLAALTARSDGA